jgi:hypothetical protein
MNRRNAHRSRIGCEILENEIIQIGAATAAIFTEGNFDAPITAPPGPVPAQGPHALAYYKPYHFHRDWGIYLRAKGILELAAGLKGAGKQTRGKRTIGRQRLGERRASMVAATKLK